MIYEGTIRGEIQSDQQLAGEVHAPVTICGSVDIPHSFGVNAHPGLLDRDKPDQHPISSISGLRAELDDKMPSNQFLTNLEIQRILES